MDNVLEKFWELSREATVVWNKHADIKKYEPYFLKILNYVKSNERYNEEFKRCFVDIVRNIDLASWEIVLFCMRELRWKEVYDVVNEQIDKSKSIGIKSIMESILKVFDDDWEDSDLYEYYRELQRS